MRRLERCVAVALTYYLTDVVLMYNMIPSLSVDHWRAHVHGYRIRDKWV